VANIATFLPDQSRNGCSIPSDFHAKCSTQKTKCKGCNGTPPKRKQLAIVPRIPVVILPACVAEYDVLFDDYN
jgi:hypothetical protein